MVVQVPVVPGARRQHGLADHQIVGAAALRTDEELDLHVDPALLALEAGLELAQARVDASGQMPLSALLPAYMITEIERGFQFGFLVFLPFLVIDIVVASILMSMGMMMLPPVIISLPFKLIFFVLVDGWSLVAGSLIQSYGS